MEEEKGRREGGREGGRNEGMEGGWKREGEEEMSNGGGRIERTGESEEGEGEEGNEGGRRKRGKRKERRKERKGSGGDIPLQNLASDKAALQEKDTVLKFHSSHFI